MFLNARRILRCSTCSRKCSAALASFSTKPPSLDDIFPELPIDLKSSRKESSKRSFVSHKSHLQKDIFPVKPAALHPNGRQKSIFWFGQQLTNLANQFVNACGQPFLFSVHPKILVKMNYMFSFISGLKFTI